MSLTGMKKHIQLLEEAELVTTEKVGRVRKCTLAPYAFEGSAPGCNGSTASHRSSNARKEHDEHQRKEGQQQAARSTKEKEGFTAEEKAAMRARARELKAAEDGETAVRAALATMSPPDRAIGRAAPRDHQSQRAGPLAQDLVRDACLRQGRQGRLLLPRRGEVQGEVRDVRLQRHRKP